MHAAQQLPGSHLDALLARFVLLGGGVAAAAAQDLAAAPPPHELYEAARLVDVLIDLLAGTGSE